MLHDWSRLKALYSLKGYYFPNSIETSFSPFHYSDLWWLLGSLLAYQIVWYAYLLDQLLSKKLLQRSRTVPEVHSAAQSSPGDASGISWQVCLIFLRGITSPGMIWKALWCCDCCCGGWEDVTVYMLWWRPGCRESWYHLTYARGSLGQGMLVSRSVDRISGSLNITWRHPTFIPTFIT